MKRLDIPAVRFVPFFLYAYVGYVIYKAYQGESVIDLGYIFGNSFMYSITMFLISVSNPKYHCSYNRAMYIVLMIVPLINFFDAKYCIFEEAEYQLLVLSILWFITAIITSFMAVNHFFYKRIRKAWSCLMKIK